MRWSGQRVPLPVPRKRGLKWAMDYIAVPPIRQGLTTADYKRPAPGSMRVPKLPSQHIALSAPSGLRIVIPAPNSIRRGGGTATCSASGGSCNSTTNGCPKSKCTGKRVDRHGRGCLSEHCARCVQSWYVFRYDWVYNYKTNLSFQVPRLLIRREQHGQRLPQVHRRIITQCARNTKVYRTKGMTDCVDQRYNTRLSDQ